VRPLERLGRELGVELWLKDDGLCAPRYGGNKVRKLEPLLAAARTRGAQSVVTVGGIGSNHVLATAVHARALGLAARAVVVPQPPTSQVVRTLELARTLCDLVPCPTRALVPLYLARAARAAPQPAFVIGPGGSSPLGTLGCVSAGLELAAQIAARELPAPAAVFVALGSGGSAAGLALGLALAGLETPVVAVRVVERVLANRSLTRLLAWRAARLLRRSGAELPAAVPIRLEVEHDEFGDEYGRPTPAARGAVERAAEAEGLALETTYTGKALAGLVRCAAQTAHRQRLLFWNTHNARDLAELTAGSVGAPPLPEPIQRWLRS
jgi:D-cysteine desulfhydrase